MKAIEVLMGARQLLSDRKRWIKNDYARTQRGTSVEPNDPTAVKFCSDGALYSVTNCDSSDYQSKARMKAEQYFIRANDLSGIVSFNDKPTTKHKDVLAAFDKAILYAQKKSKKKVK